MKTTELLQGDEWLGHPAHPAFVTLPIGLWTFGLLMDMIASITKNECAQDAADYAVTAGLVGAGLSAATGLGEFLRVPAEGQPLQDGLTHGALNVGAVGLYSINAIIRNGRRGAGRPGGFLPKLLSMVGVGAIAYSGWLGGMLAYKHGVGVQVEGGTGKKNQPESSAEPASQQPERETRRRRSERAVRDEVHTSA